MAIETNQAIAEAPPLPAECCATCRFARPAYRTFYGGSLETQMGVAGPIDDSHRICHRTAPTRGPWPSLDAGEWCGEHEFPKTENADGERDGTETKVAGGGSSGGKGGRAAGKN